MTKRSFLAKLKSKLSILEKQEIEDIIEEYSSHIDSKIKKGKTEKEAVLDFGNIDELVKEILSAYKINSSYKEDESKFEIFIDDFIGKIIEFFKNLFDDLSEQKVSKIIITILYLIIGLILCGILLWFVRIPFEIVKEIGIDILSVGSNNFITDSLEFIWVLFIQLTSIVVSIIIVASLIKKAIENYGFKENKIIASELKNDVKKDLKPKEVTNDSALMDFFIVCLKIFVIVSIYIPLLMSNIGLAITLGFIVFFALKGIVSIGMIVIIIGLLMITSSLTALITNFLFSKGGVK